MNAADRIQWLHKRIAAGHYPNASRLAERFSISHRQAQRDVDYLHHQLCAPIAYDAAKRGFYYKEEFVLPVYTEAASETDYVEAAFGLQPPMADQEILQMQIPYTAVLHVPDKLARVELQRFIVAEDKQDRYTCEFHNVDIFLGLLLSLEGTVTVEKPDWLREKLIAAARRILENHGVAQ